MTPGGTALLLTWILYLENLQVRLRSPTKHITVTILIIYNFLEWGTRETALLYSYFTSAATWALAADCKSEKLVNCPCIKSEVKKKKGNGDVVFFGCNANVDYARDYLDMFVLDNQKNSKNTWEQLNWWNSIVGYNVSGKTSLTFITSVT